MIRTKLRRPRAARVNLYSGNFTVDNPNGLGNGWKYTVEDEAAVYYLMGEIQARLDVGIEWIIINRWTGECEDQDGVISTEPWNTLPAGRKAALIAIFLPWWAAKVAANPKLMLLLYVSSQIRNDRDYNELCNVSDDAAFTHPPDPTDPLDAAFIHACWDPLVVLGFRGWVADNAAVEYKVTSTNLMYDHLSDDFFDEPVEFIQEAVPRITDAGDPDRYMPDVSRIYRQRSFCFLRFVRANQANNVGQRLWEIDPKQSDSLVCFTQNEKTDDEGDAYEPTRDDAVSMLHRGWGICAASPDSLTWVAGLSTAVPPSNLQVTPNPSSNYLTWSQEEFTDELDDPIEVSFYEIWRSTSADGPFTKLGESETLSYVDDTASPDVEYFYYVNCWTEYNYFSDPSEVVSSTVTATEDIQDDRASYRPRLVMLRTLAKIIKGMRSGRYRVHRGPIDYPTFDYQSTPFAASILCPDFPLRKQGNDFFHRGTIIIELTTRLNQPNPPGLNDAIIDQLSVDAEGILLKLENARNDQGDPVILAVSKDPAPRCREMSNSDWGIQGIELTVIVDY